MAESSDFDFSMNKGTEGAILLTSMRAGGSERHEPSELVAVEHISETNSGGAVVSISIELDAPTRDAAGTVDDVEAFSLAKLKSIKLDVRDGGGVDLPDLLVKVDEEEDISFSILLLLLVVLLELLLFSYALLAPRDFFGIWNLFGSKIGADAKVPDSKLLTEPGRNSFLVKSSDSNLGGLPSFTLEDGVFPGFNDDKSFIRSLLIGVDFLVTMANFADKADKWDKGFIPGIPFFITPLSGLLSPRPPGFGDFVGSFSLALFMVSFNP